MEDDPGPGATRGQGLRLANETGRATDAGRSQSFVTILLATIGGQSPRSSRFVVRHVPQVRPRDGLWPRGKSGRLAALHR
jgi:hypothetical protein